jgi:hypothetical protein
MNKKELLKRQSGSSHLSDRKHSNECNDWTNDSTPWTLKQGFLTGFLRGVL